MTPLPIVERELIVRARQARTHWMRVCIGAVAVLLSLQFFVLWSNVYSDVTQTAVSAFQTLSWLGFLLACGGWVLTADCISAERRDGTLGLLMLARVSAGEVILGKLAAHGLAAVFGLVAMMPMLMLPVLAGGVTWSEVLWTAASWLAMLWFSLCLGLWASSKGGTMAQSLKRAAICFVVMTLPPMVLGTLQIQAGAIALGQFVRSLSPHAAFVETWSMATTPPGLVFFASLIVSGVWGLMFLGFAGYELRRSEEPGPHSASSPREERVGRGSRRGEPLLPGADSCAPARSALRAFGSAEFLSPLPSGSSLLHSHGVEGENTDLRSLDSAAVPNEGGELGSSKTGETPVPPLAVLSSSRRPLGDMNPLEWFLAQDRAQLWALWFAAGFISLLPFSSLILRYMGGISSMGLFSAFYLLGGIGSAALFALAGARFLSGARRVGSLELLRTTPLGGNTMVQSVWRVLRRRLVGPLLLMVLPVLVINAYYWFSAFKAPTTVSFGVGVLVWQLLLNPVCQVLDAVALCWLGMWFGLRARNLLSAVLLSVGLVWGLDWIMTYGFHMIYSYSASTVQSGLGGGWQIFSMILVPLLTIVKQVWLVLWARKQLRENFAGTDPVDFRTLCLTVLAWLRKARHWTGGGT